MRSLFIDVVDYVPWRATVGLRTARYNHTREYTNETAIMVIIMNSKVELDMRQIDGSVHSQP